SLRGARRIVTESTALVRSKLPRRCHLLRWSDLRARFANCRLRTEGPAPQVLFAHHDCIANLRSTGEDARLHLEGPQRPADSRSDECGRNSGIHGETRAAVADNHTAVEQHGLAEVGRILSF